MDLQHLNVPAQLETLLKQILDNQPISTKFRLDLKVLTTAQKTNLIKLLSIVKSRVQMAERA